LLKVGSVAAMKIEGNWSLVFLATYHWILNNVFFLIFKEDKA
jgi:hypothetical protein